MRPAWPRLQVPDGDGVDLHCTCTDTSGVRLFSSRFGPRQARDFWALFELASPADRAARAVGRDDAAFHRAKRQGIVEFIRELIVAATREGLAAARDMLPNPGTSITRLLGVSPSTLYNHIPDLQQLRAGDTSEPPAVTDS
ncbi:hypothetical protein [Nonomuraea sp. SBT364]|uniref:hypothetical protein n=1 Tax=Nonomuraea sp. SBT364 TaxID=1580530 RepID=UPI00066E0056|nr:hypothetical protein [Nonomuraea sp. SBT364]